MSYFDLEMYITNHRGASRMFLKTPSKNQIVLFLHYLSITYNNFDHTPQQDFASNILSKDFSRKFSNCLQHNPLYSQPT